MTGLEKPRAARRPWTAFRGGRQTDVSRPGQEFRHFVQHLLIPLVLGAVTMSAAETPVVPRFTHVPLGAAVLSLPEGWAKRGEDPTLWLHLHGAKSVLEKNFQEIGAPGILVTLTLPGLSRVYADHFADEAVFGRLLADVESALGRESPVRPRRVTRVVVSSFSAGFGGVRQLLRQPAAFARIDVLVMADSIYCGYTGDPARKQVDPDLMAGFLRFARLAVAGEKRFVLSHSRQVPEGYASTTETADYLIGQLGLVRSPAEPAAWPGGLRLLSHSERGGFEILGFGGDAAEDHLNHLRNIGVLLQRARPAGAVRNDR